MEIDFKVREYNYDCRLGNLETEAKGIVKSEKHFPIFESNTAAIPLTLDDRLRLSFINKTKQLFY